MPYGDNEPLPPGVPEKVRRKLRELPIRDLRDQADVLFLEVYRRGYRDAVDDLAKEMARVPNRAVGGRARASRLTPERRREIAQQAAAARWGSQ